MNVSITGIYVKNGDKQVMFTTAFGEGFATWKGEFPIIGQAYDVEMEFPKVFEWGKDIFSTNTETFSIITSSNLVYFTVKLESMNEEDGCCVARLGESIVLLETVGSTTNVGEYLKFKADDVILYVNNL